MPQITLKETITRKIDIPIETLLDVVDSLSDDDKKKLMSRIGSRSLSLKKFKKGKLSAIIADFSGAGLYEKEFLADLESGLKKSSLYR